MELYVGPLPKDINQYKLKCYFKGFEKHMTVQFQHMGYEGKTNTFAIINVNSPRIGKRLIDKFAGQVISGIPVDVREFVHRCSCNERRSVKWRNHPWKFFNRRNAQRRKYRYAFELEDAWLKEEQRKLAQA